MNSKVTEGIQNLNFTFFNFPKRQSVSKSKVEENVVQKAWSTSSSGFGRNKLFDSHKKNEKLNKKSQVKGGEYLSPTDRNGKSSLHERLTGSDYKAVKRKSMLEIGNFEADAYPLQKRNDSCVISSNQFLQAVKQAEKRHKTKDKLKRSNPKRQCDILFPNIENPFRNSSTTPSIDFKAFLSPDDLPPEQENIQKKRKIPDGHFVDLSLSFSSPISVKEVLKKNVFPSPLHQAKSIEHSNAASNSSFKDNSISLQAKGGSQEDRTLLFKSLLNHSGKSLNSSIFTRSKICLNDSSADKGSNWVQSLQWTPQEQDDTNQDRFKKKKLRNIIPGGYAEQLLKLQRREHSEKVFWEHKRDQSEEKEMKKCAVMQIVDISPAVNDIVITKCTCSDIATFTQNIQKHAQNYLNCESESISTSQVLQNSEIVKNVPEYTLFIVLFIETHFRQLQLKAGEFFRLYPPWQTLNSSPYPVILCTYFVEKVSSPSVNHCGNFCTPCSAVDSHASFNAKANLPSDRVSRESSSSTMEKELFFMREEKLSIIGRVQRIVCYPIRAPDNFPEALKCSRTSFILQTKEGTIHEVIISSTSLPDHWLEFISSAEGKCFSFHNLHLTHRLSLEKHGDLLNFLIHFQDKSRNVKFNQKYCYQLMIDICSGIPEDMCDENFPPYLQPEVQLMSNLSKVPPNHRVSFIGNILLEHRNVFIVSDKSLLHAPLKKYLEMVIFPFKRAPLEMGSTVFIREALVDDGCIVLDKYSNVVALSKSSNLHSMCNSPLLLKNMKKLAPMTIEEAIMPLGPLSKTADIVKIEGVIKNVNESTAVSFLQCCFCLQENLIQDSSLVIYCEDCSQIVPKPILGIKLEVSICCKSYKSASVEILLLSSSVKEILNIKENTYQPQCRVADVLEKNIGPIICFVKKCGTVGMEKVFHLQEIKSS